MNFKWTDPNTKLVASYVQPGLFEPNLDYLEPKAGYMSPGVWEVDTPDDDDDPDFFGNTEDDIVEEDEDD